MAQPPIYTTATSFAQDEANAVGGRSIIRTAALDAELSGVQTTLAATLANLALVQRDDGKLRDATVELHALSADVRALVAAGQGLPRGAWLTATTYALRDIVTQSGNSYLCAVAHTSGTFATDLSAVRWMLLTLGTSPTAAGVTFTPTTNLAATSVQEAIQEADTENRALTAALSAAFGAFQSTLAGSAGSSSVGYTQAGAGAVATTAQSRFRRTIWADDFNTLTDALVYASSLGRRGVRLTGGKRYTLTSRLQMGQYPGCGLYCVEGTAEIYAPASAFTNNTVESVGRYIATSAAIDISGLKSGLYTPSDEIFLCGFRITSEVADGRMVDAVTAQNCKRPRLESLQFSGFPAGCDIRLASWEGGYIGGTRHLGRTSTHVWPSGGVTQGAQLTGIEIDNDQVNGVPTVWTVIDRPEIENFVITGQTDSARNHQSDGINIAKRTTEGVRIIAPRIKNCGEGIDCFGRANVIIDPVINDSILFGLKFIHGARFNSVSGGTITDSGLGGIVFAGTSDVGAGDTERNTINGTTVQGLDPHGTWAANSHACVRFQDNVGTTGKPKNNTLTGCALSQGANGKYGWLDECTGSGNFGEGCTISPGGASVKRVEVLSGGGSVRLAGSGTYSTSLV